VRSTGSRTGSACATQALAPKAQQVFGVRVDARGVSTQLGAPRARWRALFDRFMPAHAAGDPEVARRARLAIAGALVCIPLGVLYAVRLQWMLDDPIRNPLSGMMLGMSGVCATALWLLKRGAPIQWAVHATLGYVVGTCAILGYFLGGMQGPLPYWLVIVPATAVFSCSLRSGLGWLAVCQVVYAGFAWSSWQGLEHALPARPLLAQLWFGSICGLFLTSFALVVTFDRTREEALRVLGVTQRALLRARDHARGASQSKSTFLARVSQDLRTPMGVISGSAELLAKRVGPEDPANESLTTIERNARRLTQIIDRIVDLAQMETERFAIEQVPCDPRALIAEVIESQGELAAQRDIALHAEINDDAPSQIVTDPARLRQVLHALVGNAIQFSGGRDVAIALGPAPHASGEPHFRLEVRDDGIGIAADKLERIFEPFQQAAAGEARRFGGAGLGLWIARRVCERMGGRISVASAPGRGTAFRAELPVGGATETNPVAGADRPEGTERAAAGFWERLPHRFVPESLKDDPGALHQARMVLGLAVAPTPALLCWAIVLAHILEPPVGTMFGALLVVTAPMLWSLTLLFRHTGSLRLAGNALAAYVFVTLGALAYCGGGASSPSTYWLMLIPAAAPVLGVRSGAVWSGLGLALCASFYALERLDMAPYNWLAADMMSLTSVASASTLSALTTALMALYERTHCTAIALAASSNEELRSARQEAERASQNKSDFLANMSHELRTPMTAILGHAELLAEQWGSSLPHLRRTVWIVQRSARQLLALVNDLMDLNRLHEGRIDLERVAFGPEELCRKAVDLLRDRATTKALELGVRVLPPVPERVQGDPTRVRQVLVNLIGNAIKFTHTGSVEVRLSAGEGWIRYEIADTGPGLGEEQHQALLRPLRDETGATAALAQGSGLGLTVSRLLCELMGGELGARSAPGTGTCVHVQIPAAPAPAPRSAPAENPAANAAPIRLRSRVLLVEDSPDNQTLISHLLRKAGATVAVAGNGQEGLDQIQASEEMDEPFGLVLMDLQMPVLDGYGAMRELRRRGSTLPVVALTAHALEEERLRCLEAGFDAFATKPIDRRALLALVKEWSAEEKAEAEAQ
jgi:signal transduction histidine kinase